MKGHRSLACFIGFFLFLQLGQIVLPFLAWGGVRKSFSKGYQAFQKKDYGPAAKILAKVASDDFPLQDYALWGLGVSQLSLKKCNEARLAFEVLVTKYPSSRWRRLSEKKLVEVAFCGGDAAEIDRKIEEFLKEDWSSKEKGALLLKRGETGDLRRIVRDFPLSPASEEAAEKLSTQGLFPDQDWFSLARDLLHGGHCERAYKIYRKLSGGRGAGGLGSMTPAAPLAACLFESRRYEMAKHLFQEVCAAKREAPSCLVKLAQAAARSDDFPLAIKTYRKILTHFPKSREAALAKIKIPFLYEDSGEYEKAIPPLREFLEGKEGRKGRERLLERLAWATYRTGRTEEALQLFEEGSRDYPFNGFFGYWEGRLLEKRGQEGQAAIVYDDLVDHNPSSYYALRVISRRREGYRFSFSVVPQGAPRWVRSNENEDLPDVATLQKVKLLNDWGFPEEARIELRRYRRECGGCSLYHPSLRERSVANQDETYPLPYADIVFSAAREIDPYLVYAMMRQESRFKEKVRSPAGALGLMQLMPLTAKRVAEEADWDDFDPEQVTDPEVNIRLGVEYLKILGRYFSEDLLKVASYNAGEEAVKRWLKSRSTLPLDEFIEEIPYSETRDYVKKVYVNWQAYQFIYH